MKKIMYSGFLGPFFCFEVISFVIWECLVTVMEPGAPSERRDCPSQSWAPDHCRDRRWPLATITTTITGVVKVSTLPWAWEHRTCASLGMPMGLWKLKKYFKKSESFMFASDAFFYQLKFDSKHFVGEQIPSLEVHATSFTGACWCKGRAQI